MMTLTTLEIETSPGTSTSKPARSIPASIVLWSATIALAAMFVMAGRLKLAGAPAMVQLFDAIGLGQWFRYVTGTIKIGSAILLLIASLASLGGFAGGRDDGERGDNASLHRPRQSSGADGAPRRLPRDRVGTPAALTTRVPGGSTRHSSYDGPQFIFSRKS
jgi:hypothetical protein